MNTYSPEQFAKLAQQLMYLSQGGGVKPFSGAGMMDKAQLGMFHDYAGSFPQAQRLRMPLSGPMVNAFTGYQLDPNRAARVMREPKISGHNLTPRAEQDYNIDDDIITFLRNAGVGF
jgi:hypothetical protein